MQFRLLQQYLVLLVHLNGEFVFLRTKSKLQKFFLFYVFLFKLIELLVDAVLLEGVDPFLFAYF